MNAQSFDPAAELITLLENNKVVLEADQKSEIQALAQSYLLDDFPTGGTVKKADFKNAVQEYKRKVTNDILTADQRQTFKDNK